MSSIISAVALLLAGPASAVPAPDIASGTSRANAALIARYYPASSIRRGEEGPVGFRVTLDRDGRIESCTVTSSSGFAALDERTCDLMVETARFTAIRDATGWRAGSTHDGRIVWRIPSDRLPDRLAVAGRPPKRRPDDRIVCRRQFRHGSLYVKEKVCLSAADWRRQIDYSQATVHAMQAPGGPLIF